MKQLYSVPLVSVIIPTHNAETTIERCINSISAQSYPNIEIITCDDCSSDRTVEIVNQIESKFKIVSIVNQDNMGAAFTRNKCIDIAQGELIAQIDDDDYCMPDRIEKQVEFLKNNHEYAFIGTGAYFFDENGVWGKSSISVGYSPKKQDFLHNSCFMNPTTMLRLDCLRKVGCYRVAKETRRGQDYDLYMRLYVNGYKGYIMPEELTYYYRGRNNYKKCKYKYRINEAQIRYKNFRDLGLMPKGYLFVIKPLIVGLLPMKIIELIKMLFKK